MILAHTLTHETIILIKSAYEKMYLQFALSFHTKAAYFENILAQQYVWSAYVIDQIPFHLQLLLGCLAILELKIEKRHYRFTMFHQLLKIFKSYFVAFMLNHHI